MEVCHNKAHRGHAGEFPKIGGGVGTILGVPIIRTIVFGVYIGVPL